MTKTCAVCGKEFSTIPHGRKRRFCSDKCCWASHREKSNAYRKDHYIPRGPREIICKNCGKPFMGMYTQKYCMACLENATSGPLKKYYENRK